MLRFADRADAGRRLAAVVVGSAGTLVLGLPRGGVPVAAEVAAALDAPLDVFLVRKLGLPGHPELAMGALATGGVQVRNEDVLRLHAVRPEQLAEVVSRETAELERRQRAYRGDRPPPPIAGRDVVLVDDGLATGATMRAAVEAVRLLSPSAVVVAVPVGAPDACRRIAEIADDVVCLHAPADFGAVGAYDKDFRQTSDDEVRALLSR